MTLFNLTRISEGVKPGLLGLELPASGKHLLTDMRNQDVTLEIDK